MKRAWSDVILSLMLVLVAVAWAFGGQWAAGRVKEVNSTRYYSLAPLVNRPTVPGLPNLFNPPVASRDSVLPGPGELDRNTVAVEVIASVWLWSTRLAALVLAVVGLAGLLRGRLGRPARIASALLFLAVTAGTRVGIWALGRPAWGGLPPLPVLSYILATLLVGWPAVVLLALNRPEIPNSSI